MKQAIFTILLIFPLVGLASCEKDSGKLQPLGRGLQCFILSIKRENKQSIYFLCDCRY